MELLGIDVIDISIALLVLACVVLLFLIVIRLYVKFTCVKFGSNVDLKGKTVLITGANSGIGKEVARFMAKKGARVIMACRTMETAMIARDEIAAESENSEIVLHKLDLSSFQSIRQFASKVLSTESHLDVLIHNAGYDGFIKKVLSVDGIEYTMAANHYGSVLLTHLLIDLLKKSAPSRIVITGSKAHTLSFLNPNKPDHVNPVGFWLPYWLYFNSKLANLLFTYELARRLKGTGVTVNALHPGSVDTEIWRNQGFPNNILMWFMRKFLRSPEEGIQTTLHVALSSSLDNVSGVYFRDCKPGTPSKDALKEDWQRKMWDESVKLVKLTSTDPQI